MMGHRLRVHRLDAGRYGVYAHPDDMPVAVVERETRGCWRADMYEDERHHDPKITHGQLITISTWRRTKRDAVARVRRWWNEGGGYATTD